MRLSSQVVYFLLFWLSSIRTSVSFLAISQKQRSVCGPSSKFWARVGRAGEILQPCTSRDLQRSQSTRIKAPPKPASQPSSRHPQPKPLLKLESNCGLQPAALQRSTQVSRRPAAAGPAATALLCLSQAHPGASLPACLPCPAGTLGCVSGPNLRKKKQI